MTDDQLESLLDVLNRIAESLADINRNLDGLDHVTSALNEIDKSIISNIT